MILKKLCYGLSGSLFLASSLLTISSHAATDSIGLTVTTDIEMGTCTSMLTDDGTAKLSTINFGDVYISEINAETKIKTFKLQFKDCAGIPGEKAKIKLTPRALCEGNSNNGPGFANASTQQQKQRQSPLRSGVRPHQVKTAQNNSVASPPQQKKSVLLVRREVMMSITR
ncbi:fimbrial-like adhesin protein [Escherichia coli KTE84]|nr:fimbrial-like adhesin protein [Escherichia coli KTE84]